MQTRWLLSWISVIPILERDGSFGDRICKNFLTMLLFSGWLVASSGEIGVSVWPAILVVLIFWIFLVADAIIESRPSKGDLRWLFVPLFVVILGWVDPLWSSPMQWDQADHLQTANRYLERWGWEPFHQGKDFSFRPKIMSGLLAIELGLSGRVFHAYLIPLLCLIACGWQIQSLAEHDGRIIGGILASLLVLCLPAMIIYGRTAYLEALATGGLVLVFRIVLKSLENGKLSRKDAIAIGIIASLLGAVKYPYLYLVIFLPTTFFFWGQTKENLGYLVLSWGLVQSPFFMSDLLQHGSPFASYDTQATGAVNSLVGDYGDYGASQFLADISGEIGRLLFISILFCSFLWVKIGSGERWSAIISIVFPSLLIFSMILDFGYPRYHLPWLSVLICVACNWLSHNLESMRLDKKIDNETLFSIFVLILISHQIFNVIDSSIEKRDQNIEVIKYREDYLEEYIELGSYLSDNSVVLTGFDITLGVRFGVPTYRFGPSDDPIHDSIKVVDATHVVIGGKATRFNWEADPLMILGSPIDPVASSSRDADYATLWGVNHSRLEYHESASELEVRWSIRNVGDMFLVSENELVKSPENWKIIQVIDLGDNESYGGEAIDLLFGRNGGGTIICSENICQQEFIVPEDTRYLVKLRWSDER